MPTEEDYTEEDRYDWDRSDPGQYCKHGTFIGSWWGPDILCMACEQGMTDAEWKAWQWWNAWHAHSEKVQMALGVLEVLGSKPNRFRLLGCFMPLLLEGTWMVHEHYRELVRLSEAVPAGEELPQWWKDLA